MLYYKVIHEALNSIKRLDGTHECENDNLNYVENSLVAQLLYDIFGGEILKTRRKNCWYFYNRIQGEQIDFTRPSTNKYTEYIFYEDLHSSPDDTCKYFEQEDYIEFYLRFLKAFDEAVYQQKYQKVYAE